MSAAIWSRANINAQASSAIAESLRMVRRIIATEQFRTSGLTTAEMYKLALKEKPSADFKSYEVPSDTEIRFTKSGNRKAPPPVPPHPEHPVRSMQFFKKQVLPVIEGHKEIRMTTGKRLHTVPEATAEAKQAVKGKGKGKAAAINSSTPAAATTTASTVWLWMPTQKPRVTKSITPPSSTLPYGYEVGLGQDWDHLSKRRRRVRGEKVKHDINIMVQYKKAERQKRKRETWEAIVSEQEKRTGAGQVESSLK